MPRCGSPSGRRLSLVDVPGHERLIRVDGVRRDRRSTCSCWSSPPTTASCPRRSSTSGVLEALGVSRGVVAVTKSDLADPGPAVRAAAELLPGVDVVACSARTGAGVGEVAAALERAAAGVGRARKRRAARSCTSTGCSRSRASGTVVTGTLWSGEIQRGDRLRLVPGDRGVRVRGLQVHDRAVERALAGQRVAVNLAGVERRAVSRGDVLAADGAGIRVDVPGRGRAAPRRAGGRPRAGAGAPRHAGHAGAGGAGRRRPRGSCAPSGH